MRRRCRGRLCIMGLLTASPRLSLWSRRRVVWQLCSARSLLLNRIVGPRVALSATTITIGATWLFARRHRIARRVDVSCMFSPVTATVAERVAALGCRDK